jgi:uncharacterized membrane protein YczE
MYEESNGKLRKLKLVEILKLLTVSLLLNAIGNGLSISTNMGSAFWTASAANLANITGISISVFLISYGVLVTIVNALLVKKFNLIRSAGNLTFVLFFGTFVGIFTNFFNYLGVGKLPFVIRIPLDFIGIICIGLGVSIYQRISVVIHPVDEMTSIIRFNFLKGNVVKAQLVNFAFPIMLVSIIFITTHSLVAVNIGTIFALLFQGSIIAMGDKYLFKKLKHNLRLLTKSKE